MKTLLPVFLFLSLTSTAQVANKAGFGVDADLRANFYNGFIVSGNDDWYLKDAGSGQYVIDTTGAYQIIQSYLSDVGPSYPIRMSSFFRTMRKDKPPYTIVNNKMWLDALFVRDYHGNDTTAFTLASKNGDSPANWTSDIQGIPDKNDILDVFMHVRRDLSASGTPLWFLGGISLDQVTGNRYFDFELYQTDIYYDRASKKWFGYGPDAGHTAWQFDAAGNVTRPGDIIFSAYYQSAGLDSVQARIWVDKASLSITPANFDWSYLFDGASSSSQFGYASIMPKNTSTSFYSGVQCKNGEWTGAFQVVLQNNSLATTYLANQFMEFSVNLTQLGLDPVATFGSDVCGTPFNRFVVKTRASSSFTAALKDFVAPTDLFLAPRVQAVADVPMFCGTMGVSNLSVQNPYSSSVYNWTTTDGHIIGSTSGTSISVDQPGTYIVTQRLSSLCNPYATDTVAVVYDATCTILANSLTMFKGSVTDKIAQLNWTTTANNTTDYFEVQRSFDGKNFMTVKTVKTEPGDATANYAFQEDISSFNKPYVYYRLKIKMQGGVGGYSNVLRLNFPINSNDAMIFPNPANDIIQLAMTSDKKQDVKMQVYDFAGALVETRSYPLIQGTNVFSVNVEKWKQGAYVVELVTPNQTIHKKLIVQRQMQVR